jgi:hypothetical protein
VSSNEYHKIILSTLEGCISFLEEKVVEIIRNTDIRPPNVKKVARKLECHHKFMKSFKADLICL